MARWWQPRYLKTLRGIGYRFEAGAGPDSAEVERAGCSGTTGRG
jgi:hypothetical protein